MVKEFNHRVGEFVLACEVKENLIIFDSDYIVITSITGDGSMLKIPETIEVSGVDLKVRAIEKKACLGHKGLTTLELPSTIERVEDWAFAQCDNLKTVCVYESISQKVDKKNITTETITAEAISDGNHTSINSQFVVGNNQDSKIRFGRGVFDDCKKIHSISLDGNLQSAMSALLGALPYRLDAEYLLCSDHIGSSDWYENWDQSLCMYLLENDEEGYTNVVLCGEEDIQRSVSEFISDKRKSKSALCMLRLVNDSYLTEESKQKYTEYLLANTKGQEAEDAWYALLEEYGDNLAYYELFANIGAINKENVDAMIVDMADAYPEAKAFVMRYKQENLMDGDIFAGFEL